MGDTKMPDYANEPNEWESNRAVKFPRHIEMEMKIYTPKIQQAHTLQALAVIRRNIERSPLCSNLEAKQQMQNLVNRKAVELKWKPAHPGERFWQ